MSNKHELVQAVMLQGRQMSGRILMFHQSVAARFGLHATDHKCLDLARGESEITAGRLAELTGLTTGAITAAIDRLEAAGFVERKRDSDDRRVVRVHVRKSGVKKLARAFDEFKQRMIEVSASFSADELEVISRYQSQCIDVLSKMTRSPSRQRKSVRTVSRQQRS